MTLFGTAGARQATVAQRVDVGGSAVVFKAQTSDGSCVALKVITQVYSASDQEVTALRYFSRDLTVLTFDQLLRRELQLARQVRHPRILPYLGTSKHGFHTILVSPFMSNGNLTRFLAVNPNADRGRFVRMFSLHARFQ